MNERWIVTRLFPLLLGITLIVYSWHRQKYIGAVDFYGYFAEGQAMQSGGVHLPTAFPVDRFPSGVPLGFVAVGDHAVPQYPPGFPLLLAIGGLAGIPTLVTPLVGLLSCVLMYLVLRDLADRKVAVVLTLVWAYFPTTVFGSTTIMSDGVATTFVLACYVAYRRGWIAASAWAFGFALAIRPTNLLFAAPLGLLLLRDRRLLSFGLHLIAPVALYGLYNLRIYGAPWRTGYADIRADLLGAVFTDHFVFYLRQMFWQGTPLLVLLSLLGLRRWNSDKLFFVLWFAVFLVFYSFWRSGGDRWWWTRFLHPGIPPLFFLAASGLSSVRDWIAAKAGATRPWIPNIALAAVAIAVPVFEIRFGWNQHDLWIERKGHDYYDIATDIGKVAPPGSAVGSVEFAGSFNLYTSLIPFVSTHDNSPAFVAEAFSRGMRVFIVVERWNKDDAVVKSLFTDFKPRLVTELKPWGGLPVYELTNPAAR